MSRAQTKWEEKIKKAFLKNVEEILLKWFHRDKHCLSFHLHSVVEWERNQVSELTTANVIRSDSFFCTAVNQRWLIGNVTREFPIRKKKKTNKKIKMKFSFLVRCIQSIGGQRSQLMRNEKKILKISGYWNAIMLVPFCTLPAVGHWSGSLGTTFSRCFSSIFLSSGGSRAWFWIDCFDFMIIVMIRYYFSR